MEFLGRVPVDELRALRREAAVVLVPSRSDESFGLVALEAMAAGVPVVATAGRRAAGAGRRGALRAARRRLGDGGAAADLWADPERRRREGDALIARARERYSAERFTRDLLDLYERLGS